MYTYLVKAYVKGKKKMASVKAKTQADAEAIGLKAILDNNSCKPQDVKFLNVTKL